MLRSRLRPLNARREKRHGAALRRELPARPVDASRVGVGTGSASSTTRRWTARRRRSTSEPMLRRRSVAQRSRSRHHRRPALPRAALEDDSFDRPSRRRPCTVADQTASVGRDSPGPATEPFLFSEHVRSGIPKPRPLAARLEPIWRVVGNGCHEPPHARRDPRSRLRRHRRGDRRAAGLSGLVRPCVPPRAVALLARSHSSSGSDSSPAVARLRRAGRSPSRA